MNASLRKNLDTCAVFIYTEKEYKSSPKTREDCNGLLSMKVKSTRVIELKEKYALETVEFLSLGVKSVTTFGRPGLNGRSRFIFVFHPPERRGWTRSFLWLF